MSYRRYSKDMETLCVVAVKLNQANVHAPSHTTWGVVTCAIGKEQFASAQAGCTGPGLAPKRARRGWNPGSKKITSRTGRTLTGMRFLIDGIYRHFIGGQAHPHARQADLTKTRPGGGIVC